MSWPKPKRCQETPHAIALAADRAAVTEAPRRTRVAADVDVLVVGGGPAGVGAALAAGREGANTLLVERHGMLGGMWTAGLVNPVFDFRGKGWIVKQLVDRLESEGAWRPDSRRATFDVEAMVRTLEAMMTRAGVEFWYHALMADAIVEDGRVRGAMIESKAGREAVLAKVVIDCTGDGDAAARAGAAYELGRLADGLMQPMTLMFEVDGIEGWDYAKLSRDEKYDLMVKAIERHNLDVTLPFGRVGYTPAVIVMPRPGSGVVQATHVYRLNGLDPRDVTRGIVDARVQARDLVRVFRHVPGLEGMRLIRTAATLGIRETRRICGRYQLSMDDLAAGRRFDDAVTFCKFGVDIHEPAPGSGVPSGHGMKMKPYEIPYRCLLPKGLDGLLVAGRCISGTHEAHASYRVTGACMAMGQAAGLAAAWAAKDGEPPAALDGAELRAMLAERGAGFLDA